MSSIARLGDPETRYLGEIKKLTRSENSHRWSRAHGDGRVCTHTHTVMCHSKINIEVNRLSRQNYTTLLIFVGWLRGRSRTWVNVLDRLGLGLSKYIELVLGGGKMLRSSTINEPFIVVILFLSSMYRVWFIVRGQIKTVVALNSVIIIANLNLQTRESTIASGNGLK